jgi:hypothetical protein
MERKRKHRFLKKHLIILFFLISFLRITAFSQNDKSGENLDEQSDTDLLYVIESFSFKIDGITRQNALKKAGALTTGQEISGVSALEKYIQEKQQLLYNQRVLENVFLDYSVGQVNNEGKYPVDIFVSAKDTNNFFVFPYPQYSTNYGFGLSINFIHNNFFGTMSPFEADIGYKYDEYGQSKYLLSLETGIPLKVFGTDFNLIFYNEFNYRQYLDKPFYYRNTTDLSVDMFFNLFTFTPGFIFSLIYNDEMRINNESFGGYNYLFFGPNLEFSRINWINNFRKGFLISFKQLYNYYFYLNEYNITPWGIFNEISGIIYLKLSDFFGVSSRLMLRHWGISSSNHYAGDALRGILDKDISADLMLSLNLDIPVRVLSFTPSQWLNNKKIEFFNFDLHLVPVIDTAVYSNQSVETENIFDNVLVSGGIEAVIYPQKFRSFCLRISFGKILRDNIVTGNYELYVGGRLFY